MAILNINGNYRLSTDTVNKNITKTSAGNYALGYTKDKKFIIKYIGRSVSDIKARLYIMYQMGNIKSLNTAIAHLLNQLLKRVSKLS